MFGGGWIGYVYVFGGCGILLVLLAGSTMFLYTMARLRRRREGTRVVRVVSVPASAAPLPAPALAAAATLTEDDGTDAA